MELEEEDAGLSGMHTDHSALQVRPGPQPAILFILLLSSSLSEAQLINPWE